MRQIHENSAKSRWTLPNILEYRRNTAKHPQVRQILRIRQTRQISEQPKIRLSSQLSPFLGCGLLISSIAVAKRQFVSSSITYFQNFLSIRGISARRPSYADAIGLASI